jgi:hypothetical protein
VAGSSGAVTQPWPPGSTLRKRNVRSARVYDGRTRTPHGAAPGDRLRLPAPAARVPRAQGRGLVAADVLGRQFAAYASRHGLLVRLATATDLTSEPSSGPSRARHSWADQRGGVGAPEGSCCTDHVLPSGSLK